MVKHIASAEEFAAIKAAGKPVVVDFTASWCGPCKSIAPFFEELAAKYPEIEFVKIDVDELEDVAGECGISAMPTFQVYSNGVKVSEMTGADKEKLAALCKDANEL
jgi:thioredoxin 1